MVELFHNPGVTALSKGCLLSFFLLSGYVMAVPENGAYQLELPYGLMLLLPFDLRKVPQFSYCSLPDSSFLASPFSNKNANIISESEMHTEKRANVEFNPEDIISDPGLRKPIEEYNVNIRDQVRRAYLAKGPYQPFDHNFPKTQFNKERRSFQKKWLTEFDWLEYSVANDKAYCLWCYLFKPTRADNCGKDVFTTTGFNNWKKALDVFKVHVGSFGSSHNEATRRCQAFKNQRQSVSFMLHAQGEEMEVDYRKRLTAVLHVIQYLLQQGLAFRGHDESSTSLNKGNFLQLLEWHCKHNEQVAKTLRLNAPGNCQLTSPKVQKELVSACAIETREAIFADIGDSFFSLIVKTYLRNRMGDEWLNDSMMVYIEKVIFASLDDEAILQRYQNMQNRRIQLSPFTSLSNSSSSVGNYK